MMETMLLGLQEHLQLARKYAVEGLYDTSVIFFDGAIAQINKLPSFLCLNILLNYVFKLKFYVVNFQ
ncbi:hypothetical protein SOVF_204010, partial [Spinacia oleracea]